MATQKQQFLFPTQREATTAKLILWCLCEFVDWIFVNLLNEAGIQKASVLGMTNPPKHSDFNNRVRRLFYAYQKAGVRVNSEEEREVYLAFMQTTRALLDDGETIARAIHSRFQDASQGRLSLDETEKISRREIEEYIGRVESLRMRISHRENVS